ncbi:MAG: hypothetical protein JWO82_1193 [Akkermansiaceae bacterium]|nr:hypothetical protein [Akkermansiaceae bacterium]
MKSGTNYLVPVGAGSNKTVTMGTVSDMAVNTDGKFLAYAVEPKSDQAPDHPANILKVESGTPLQVWKGEAGGAVTAQPGSPGDNAWIVDDLTFCGKDSQGHFTSGTQVFDGFYKKAAQLPDGKLAVFAPSLSARPPEMQILSGDSWSQTKVTTSALDASFNGKFLINHLWTIWENSSDGTTQADERMPGLTGWDNQVNCELVDTTRHGWTLALRKNGDTSTSYDAMLALPLWPSTNPIAKGLDNQSAMASRSEIFTPIQRQGNKPEFWVMVPAGGSTAIRVQSAATAETQVTLSPSGGLTVQPNKLASRDTNLLIGAPASAAGQEYPIDLKIGSTGSSSSPLKVKVMKARVVNVQIHPISRGTSPGGVLPSKAEMETYLNEIFKPQINAQFNVIIHDWQPLPPNVESGGNFYAIDPPGPGQTTVASTYAGGGKIEVFLMGGFETLASSGGKAPGGLNGLTNLEEHWVWLGMNHLSSGTPIGKEQWMNTLAHEIGHVILGRGHPDDSGDIVGPASLPQTDRKPRLMCSGTFRHSGDPDRKSLVKAEWDKAEGWLIDNIDNQH